MFGKFWKIYFENFGKNIWKILEKIFGKFWKKYFEKSWNYVSFGL